MSLVNPLYEVGMLYPINQPKNVQPKTTINLPIPPNVIFFREFKAGDTLPVTFKASGNLIKLESSEQTLTFLQDIFVKATKKEISFSLDQVNWKPFEKLITGSIDAKVEQSDDSEPKASIHLIANTV